MGLPETTVAVAGIIGGCGLGGFALWLRMKYAAQMSGHPLGGDRKVELLSNENERLQGQVSRLEERLSVLERIATDPAERSAREIEGLR